MTGLDCLGVDEVGYDYMALLKGAGGILSGFGGGDKGGGDAEKARLEAEKRAAEQSAKTMKMVLIGLGAVVALGTVVMVTRR